MQVFYVSFRGVSRNPQPLTARPTFPLDPPLPFGFSAAMTSLPAVSPATIRNHFPGLQGNAFLDAACVSLAPSDAQHAIAAFLDMSLACKVRDASAHHIAMDRLRAHAVSHAATLLNSSPNHVALVESTSFGLNTAAQAIRPEPGSNVLVADTEFMQVAIAWRASASLRNVEIRPVKSHQGVITPEDFEQAMDSHTKAVCVSSVQWCTGVRVDMKRLGELCKAKDIWLVADIIQELGAMKVDMQERYADFVIAGGHKWLNAPFGCGVMALSSKALERLTPPAYGYLSMEEPEGGWGQYFRTPSISPYTDFCFVREARAFEIGGTANYPGAVGLSASLALINALGADQAEAIVRRVTAYLRSELIQLGATIITPEDPALQSGITVFQWFGDPARDQALVERLLDERVLVSMRFTSGIGGIRVSVHFFNHEEDIDRLISALKRLL